MKAISMISGIANIVAILIIFFFLDFLLDLGGIVGAGWVATVCWLA